MKRMILGTMMCVLLTAGVSAQEQDTIAKREFQPNRHPRHEMRMNEDFRRPDRMPERRGEMREERFRGPEGPCAKFKDITPEQMAEFRAKMLTDQLTLTDKQNKKLNKIFLDEINDAKENKSTPEERKAKTDKQLKKCLTDAQYAKYQEMEKRHFACKNKPHILPPCHPNHPQHRHPNHPEGIN